MKRAAFLRISAIFTLITFSITESFASPTALAASPGGEVLDGISQTSLPSDGFDIPRVFGTVTESHGVFPRAVIIQDAHGQYQAQQSIESILNFLNRRHGLAGVLLEGGIGRLSSERIRFFEEEPLNRKAARILAREGEIGGPELFLMKNSSRPGRERVPAWGLEEEALYFENLAAFRESHDTNPAAQSILKRFERDIRNAAVKHFDKPRQLVFREWLRFEAGQTDMPRYLSALVGQARALQNLDLSDPREQLEWPMLTRLLEIERRGKLEDPARAAAERKRLLGWAKKRGISPRLLKTLKTAGALENLLDPGIGDLRAFWEIFYTQAHPKGFKFEDYPALSVSEGARILEGELEPDLLFKELEKLRKRLIETPRLNESQKRILVETRRFHLLSNLFSFKLTRRELRELENMESPAGNSAGGPLSGAFLRTPEFRDCYAKAARFYKAARLRDKVLAERILASAASRDQGLWAVITGGFHTRGLTKRLKKEGLAYAVLTPRMNEIEADQKYFASLLGEPARMDFTSEESPKAALRNATWLSAWSRELPAGMLARRAAITREIENWGARLGGHPKIRSEVRAAGEGWLQDEPLKRLRAHYPVEALRDSVEEISATVTELKREIALQLGAAKGRRKREIPFADSDLDKLSGVQDRLRGWEADPYNVNLQAAYDRLAFFEDESTLRALSRPLVVSFRKDLDRLYRLALGSRFEDSDIEAGKMDALIDLMLLKPLPLARDLRAMIAEIPEKKPGVPQSFEGALDKYYEYGKRMPLQELKRRKGKPKDEALEDFYRPRAKIATALYKQGIYDPAIQKEILLDVLDRVRRPRSEVRSPVLAPYWVHNEALQRIKANNGFERGLVQNFSYLELLYLRDAASTTGWFRESTGGRQYYLGASGLEAVEKRIAEHPMAGLEKILAKPDLGAADAPALLDKIQSPEFGLAEALWVWSRFLALDFDDLKADFQPILKELYKKLKRIIPSMDVNRQAAAERLMADVYRIGTRKILNPPLHYAAQSLAENFYVPGAAAAWIDGQGEKKEHYQQLLEAILYLAREGRFSELVAAMLWSEPLVRSLPVLSEIARAIYEMDAGLKYFDLIELPTGKLQGGAESYGRYFKRFRNDALIRDQELVYGPALQVLEDFYRKNFGAGSAWNLQPPRVFKLHGAQLRDIPVRDFPINDFLGKVRAEGYGYRAEAFKALVQKTASSSLVFELFGENGQGGRTYVDKFVLMPEFLTGHGGGYLLNRVLDYLEMVGRFKGFDMDQSRITVFAQTLPVNGTLYALEFTAPAEAVRSEVRTGPATVRGIAAEDRRWFEGTNILWRNVGAASRKFLIEELLRTVQITEPEILTPGDLRQRHFYETQVPLIGNRDLSGLYVRYERYENRPKGKSTLEYLLEKTGLRQPLTRPEKIQTVEQLGTALNDPALKRSKRKSENVWSQISPELQKKLVEELAAKVSKTPAQLSKNDFSETLSSIGLSLAMLLRVYEREIKAQKIAKTARWLLLERLGFIAEGLPDLKQTASGADLKKLLDAGAIPALDWGELIKEKPDLVAGLVRELAEALYGASGREELKKLGSLDYRKVVPSLGRAIEGLYDHLELKTPEGKTVPLFILEELGLIPKTVPDSRIFGLAMFRSARESGRFETGQSHSFWKDLPKGTQRDLVHEIALESGKGRVANISTNQLQKQVAPSFGIALSGMYAHYFKPERPFPEYLLEAIGFTFTKESLVEAVSGVVKGMFAYQLLSLKDPAVQALHQALSGARDSITPADIAALRGQIDQELFRISGLKMDPNLGEWKAGLESYRALLDTAERMPEAFARGFEALRTSNRPRADQLVRQAPAVIAALVKIHRAETVEVSTILGLMKAYEAGSAKNNAWHELQQIGRGNPEGFLDALEMLFETRKPAERAVLETFLKSTAAAFEVFLSELEHSVIEEEQARRRSEVRTPAGEFENRLEEIIAAAPGIDARKDGEKIYQFADWLFSHYTRAKKSGLPVRVQQALDGAYDYNKKLVTEVRGVVPDSMESVYENFIRKRSWKPQDAWNMVGDYAALINRILKADPYHVNPFWKENPAWDGTPEKVRQSLREGFIAAEWLRRFYYFPLVRYAGMNLTDKASNPKAPLHAGAAVILETGLEAERDLSEWASFLSDSKNSLDAVSVLDPADAGSPPALALQFAKPPSGGKEDQDRNFPLFLLKKPLPARPAPGDVTEAWLREYFEFDASAYQAFAFERAAGAEERIAKIKALHEKMADGLVFFRDHYSIFSREGAAGYAAFIARGEEERKALEFYMVRFLELRDRQLKGGWTHKDIYPRAKLDQAMKNWEAVLRRGLEEKRRQEEAARAEAQANHRVLEKFGIAPENASADQARTAALLRDKRGLVELADESPVWRAILGIAFLKAPDGAPFISHDHISNFAGHLKDLRTAVMRHGFDQKLLELEGGLTDPQKIILEFEITRALLESIQTKTHKQRTPAQLRGALLEAASKLWNKDLSGSPTAVSRAAEQAFEIRAARDAFEKQFWAAVTLPRDQDALPALQTARAGLELAKEQAAALGPWIKPEKLPGLRTDKKANFDAGLDALKAFTAGPLGDDAETFLEAPWPDFIELRGLWQENRDAEFFARLTVLEASLPAGSQAASVMGELKAAAEKVFLAGTLDSIRSLEAAGFLEQAIERASAGLAVIGLPELEQEKARLISRLERLRLLAGIAEQAKVRWLELAGKTGEEILKLTDSQSIAAAREAFSAGLNQELTALRAQHQITEEENQPLAVLLGETVNALEERVRAHAETVAARERKEQNKTAELAQALKTLERSLGERALAFKNPEGLLESSDIKVYRQRVEPSAIPRDAKNQLISELEAALSRVLQKGYAMHQARLQKTLQASAREVPAWRQILLEARQLLAELPAGDLAEEDPAREKLEGVFIRLESEILVPRVPLALREEAYILGARILAKVLGKESPDHAAHLEKGLGESGWAAGLRAELAAALVSLGLYHEAAGGLQDARDRFEEAYKQASLALRMDPASQTIPGILAEADQGRKRSEVRAEPLKAGQIDFLNAAGFRETALEELSRVAAADAAKKNLRRQWERALVSEDVPSAEKIGQLREKAGRLIGLHRYTEAAVILKNLATFERLYGLFAPEEKLPGVPAAGRLSRLRADLAAQIAKQGTRTLEGDETSQREAARELLRAQLASPARDTANPAWGNFQARFKTDNAGRFSVKYEKQQAIFEIGRREAREILFARTFDPELLQYVYMVRTLEPDLPGVDRIFLEKRAAGGRIETEASRPIQLLGDRRLLTLGSGWARASEKIAAQINAEDIQTPEFEDFESLYVTNESGNITFKSELPVLFRLKFPPQSLFRMARTWNEEAGYYLYTFLAAEDSGRPVLDEKGALISRSFYLAKREKRITPVELEGVSGAELRAGSLRDLLARHLFHGEIDSIAVPGFRGMVFRTNSIGQKNFIYQDTARGEDVRVLLDLKEPDALFSIERFYDPGMKQSLYAVRPLDKTGRPVQEGVKYLRVKHDAQGQVYYKNVLEVFDYKPEALGKAERLEFLKRRLEATRSEVRTGVSEEDFEPEEEGSEHAQLRAKLSGEILAALASTTEPLEIEIQIPERRVAVFTPQARDSSIRDLGLDLGPAGNYEKLLDYMEHERIQTIRIASPVAFAWSRPQTDPALAESGIREMVTAFKMALTWRKEGGGYKLAPALGPRWKMGVYGTGAPRKVEIRIDEWAVREVSPDAYRLLEPDEFWLTHETDLEIPGFSNSIFRVGLGRRPLGEDDTPDQAAWGAPKIIILSQDPKVGFYSEAEWSKLAKFGPPGFSGVRMTLEAQAEKKAKNPGRVLYAMLARGGEGIVAYNQAKKETLKIQLTGQDLEHGRVILKITTDPKWMQGIQPSESLLHHFEKPPKKRSEVRVQPEFSEIAPGILKNVSPYELDYPGLSVADVEAALGRVNRAAQDAPGLQGSLQFWEIEFAPGISEQAGLPVYASDQTRHLGNSFKILGSLNYILKELEDAKLRNVKIGSIATHTTFNHGYAVSQAFRLLRRENILPEETKLFIGVGRATPARNIALLRANGAEVLVRETYEKAKQEIARRKEKAGDSMIRVEHFDGVATGYAMIFEDLFRQIRQRVQSGEFKGKTIAVAVPAGAAGLVAAAKPLKDYVRQSGLDVKIKIIGVQTPEIDAVYQSLKEGRIISRPIPAGVRSRGIAVETPDIPLPLAGAALDYVLLVDETRHSIPATRQLLRDLEADRKYEVTGGGTTAAAVVYGDFLKREGIDAVVSVLSGANEIPRVWREVMKSDGNIQDVPVTLRPLQEEAPPGKRSEVRRAEVLSVSRSREALLEVAINLTGRIARGGSNFYRTLFPSSTAPAQKPFYSPGERRNWIEQYAYLFKQEAHAVLPAVLLARLPAKARQEFMEIIAEGAAKAGEGVKPVLYFAGPGAAEIRAEVYTYPVFRKHPGAQKLFKIEAQDEMVVAGMLKNRPSAVSFWDVPEKINEFSHAQPSFLIKPSEAAKLSEAETFRLLHELTRLELLAASEIGEAMGRALSRIEATQLLEAFLHQAGIEFKAGPGGLLAPKISSLLSEALTQYLKAHQATAQAA